MKAPPLNNLKPALTSTYPITAITTASSAGGPNFAALVAPHGMKTARSARSTPYETHDSVDLFIDGSYL
jgi:hypothetical protein